MLRFLARHALRALYWLLELLARACGRRAPYNTIRLDLSGTLPEGGGAPLPALWRSPGIDFLSVIALLRWAREDPQVRAVIVTIADLEVGWARLQEVRRALAALRQAGKQVWTYLTEGSTRDYYLASMADAIVLAPTGHLAVTGLAAETLFFKGALDKLGIEAQLHQAGIYKTAGEPFTRESMSDLHREMLNSLLDDLYSQIVDGIAAARGKSKPAVHTLIDQGLFLAQEAHASGLIDYVAYEDEVPALLEAKIGPVQLIEADLYRRRRLRAIRRHTLRTDPPRLALVTVNGPLKRGETLEGPGGLEAVGAASFARDLRRIRDDRGIVSVIVRVSSPGGSGAASDLMRHELDTTRQQKPVIISLGDVAASGGYYLALGGAPVFAEEGTITGSIGVIAGKAVLHDFYTRLGVQKEILTRGRRAAVFSDYYTLAPPERERLDFEVHAFYQDFVAKVAQCRGLSPHAVEPHAQGRIWSGRQAWIRGLVDAIGGVEDAVSEAKRRLGLPREEPVLIESFPKPPPLWRLSSLLHLLPRSHATPWWQRERVWTVMPVTLHFL